AVAWVKQPQTLDDSQKGTVAKLVLAVHVSTYAAANSNFGMAWLDRHEQSERRGKLTNLPQRNDGFNLQNIGSTIEIRKPCSTRNPDLSNASIPESVAVWGKAAGFDRCPAIEAPISPCCGERERQGCIGHRLFLRGSRRKNRKPVKHDWI